MKKILLKDCPECKNCMMEYRDGEWFCECCGYSEEKSEREAKKEATSYMDDDDSVPFGCSTCGNYDSGLYPGCLDSCPMGDD